MMDIIIIIQIIIYNNFYTSKYFKTFDETKNKTMIYKADDIINALNKCAKEDKEAVYNAIYAAREDTTYKDQLAAFDRSMKRVFEQGEFDQDAVAAALVNRLV